MTSKTTWTLTCVCVTICITDPIILTWITGTRICNKYIFNNKIYYHLFLFSVCLVEDQKQNYKGYSIPISFIFNEREIIKVKLCYNPLRLGTVIVNLRDCQFGLKVCARGNPKCLDLYKKHTATQPVMPEMRLEPLNVCLTDRCLNQLS